MDPGIYYDMPAAEYHADEGVGSGGIKKLLQSPQHFVFDRTHKREPSAAMQFGTAVHMMVLEPARSFESIAIIPDFGRSKSEVEAKEKFLFEHGGCLILKQDDYLRAVACANMVNAHPAAQKLLPPPNNGKTEVSAFWTDAEYGVPCKARYDALNLGGVIDLKTTSDASPEAFGRSAATYGYHIQGAHYWSGAEHVLNASPEFFAFICVESEPPHAVAVYYLPPVALQAGRRQADEALARYRRAKELGRWEGYPEKITPLELPRWALRNDWR